MNISTETHRIVLVYQQPEGMLLLLQGLKATLKHAVLFEGRPEKYSQVSVKDNTEQ